jgi:membrane-associated protease RseP (regulator of RpoE activity)
MRSWLPVSVCVCMFSAAPIFAQAVPTPATPGNPSPTLQAGENPPPQNPQSNRTFLGVFVVPMRPAFGNPPGAVQQGVIVQMVAPNSPAEKAGLKQGDVIVSYHGQKLSSPFQLGQLVRADKPNESVTLQVERQNKLDNVQVTLGTAPAEETGPGGMRMPRFGGPGSMPMIRPGFQQGMESAWSNFESLTIRNEGSGKYKIEAQYRAGAAGATSAAPKSFTFEGTPDEIHRKIEEAKDLGPGERIQLHRMLQLAAPGQGSPFPSMRPGFGAPPNPGPEGNP